MSGMAEVLAAHSDLQWSFEFGGFVCVECGWQETYARPYAKDAEACARASHLASVLSAAGFGPVKEASEKALTEAAEEIDRLRIIGKTPYTECAEYEARAWWAFAEVRPEEWLRARAAELSKP